MLPLPELGPIAVYGRDSNCSAYYTAHRRFAAACGWPGATVVPFLRLDADLGAAFTMSLQRGWPNVATASAANTKGGVATGRRWPLALVTSATVHFLHHLPPGTAVAWVGVSARGRLGQRVGVHDLGSATIVTYSAFLPLAARKT